jgi:metal-responsive CopG/Arc/MetJ family transcriptional regulator
MKAKLSLTLDDELVAFVDSQPGATRSEKVEAALRRYRNAWRDMKLREELAAYNSTEDDAETAAWRGVMQEVMWSESDAATSGPSRSRPSRSRGRR